MAHRCKVCAYTHLIRHVRPEIVSGITGGYGGDRRVEFILSPEVRKKGTAEFVIESSCNGMFGVPWNGDTIEPPDVRTLEYGSMSFGLYLAPDEQILLASFR